MTHIKNRIIESLEVKAKDLKPHPHNHRTHPDYQKRLLQQVLTEIGWCARLIVRRLPDGSIQLLDGHLRSECPPNQLIPVDVVDLDDQEVATFMQSFDALAGLAVPDPVEVQWLTGEAKATGALGDWFAQLAAVQAPETNPAEEWEGMPEFENEKVTCYKEFTMRFNDQGAVDEFSRLIGQQVTPSTKYLYHPKQERVAVKHLAFKGEE